MSLKTKKNEEMKNMSGLHAFILKSKSNKHFVDWRVVAEVNWVAGIVIKRNLDWLDPWASIYFSFNNSHLVREYGQFSYNSVSTFQKNSFHMELQQWTIMAQYNFDQILFC